LVAKDGSSVRIQGGAFATSKVPVVNLTIWTVPSFASADFVELTDFPDYELTCNVVDHADDFILCDGFSLVDLPVPITSGVILGLIDIDGRSSGIRPVADVMNCSYLLM
jgi:hypothetical protein